MKVTELLVLWDHGSCAVKLWCIFFLQATNQNQEIGNESNTTVTVLYSKYDVQRLAAIVGTDRAARMISSDRTVHMFMTGEW